jgi:hypothetical protein
MEVSIFNLFTIWVSLRVEIWLWERAGFTRSK